jgi:hypothetical protein
MEILPLETLTEILALLQPQQNINSLLCVSSSLHDTLLRIIELNQYKNGIGLFSLTTLLTPFVKECLRNALPSQPIQVPDLDNALSVTRAFVLNILRDEYSSILLCFVGIKSEEFFNTDKYNRRLTVGQILGNYTNPCIQLTVKYDGPDGFGFEVYLIKVVDHVLPVDEYTPLEVQMGTSLRLDNQPLLEKILTKQLGRVAMIDRSLVDDCKENERYESLELVNSSILIRYKDIAKYDTIVCANSLECRRIASLLMQFSTTPKRMIVYNESTSNPVYPFPAKLRYTYMQLGNPVSDTDVPVLTRIPHLTNLHPSMSYATLCAETSGYMEEITDVWLNSLEERQRSFLIEDCSSISFLLEPNMNWTDTVVAKEWMAACDDPRIKLRQKLQYSLRQGRGVKDSDSLTTQEAKDVCREMGLAVGGTRRQILQRILNNL